MNYESKKKRWKNIALLSIVWLILGYIITFNVFEEGSTGARLTILSLIIPIILIPVCIHKYKEAIADSKNISVEEYNREKRNEFEQQKQKYLDSKKPIIDDEGNVLCPNCGSKNIQLVSRKWSPITGFMTNKIDRICVNCKHRF